MAQTSYATTPDAGFPGMIYDLTPHKIDSLANAEASAEIPFGFGVVQGASDNAAVLPAADTDKFIGVVIHSNTYDYGTQIGDTGVKPKNILNVMKFGRCWVKVEEAVNKGDRAFLRYTVNGGNTPGGWRKSGDSSKAVELLGVTYYTSAGAGGYAVIEIDANTVRSHQA